MQSFLRLITPNLSFYVIKESRMDVKEKKVMRELLEHKFKQIELDI